MQLTNRCILFTGSEASGIYTLLPALRALEVPSGFPYLALRNRSIVRSMPHSHLNFWTAVRRLYTETGFAPVAEIPDAALSPEAKQSYIRLFARVLVKQGTQPFIVGDHLAALVLPFILEGAASVGLSVRPYFFFSAPGPEAALLRQRHAQPEALSEFLWLTTAVAALRHTGGELRLVDTDTCDGASWREIVCEIAETMGLPLSSVQLRDAPIPHSSLPLRQETRNPYTRRLHQALKEAAAGRLSRENLLKEVQDCHALLDVFSGWQYADCMDLGEMDVEARRLLARAEATPEAVSQCQAVTVPETAEAFMPLLEEKEAELLAARRDFDTRLFLHSDSVHRHYMHCLQTEKKIFESAMLAQAEALRQKYARLKAACRRCLVRVRSEGQGL